MMNKLTRKPLTEAKNLNASYNRIERIIAKNRMTVHEVRVACKSWCSGVIVQSYFEAARNDEGRLEMTYRLDGTPEYTLA